jgi:chromosome segregation ATPase
VVVVVTDAASICMKRQEEASLPGGLNTYTEYDKRTIRWYVDKIERLQRHNSTLKNDVEQMSNVLRLQQEQIARHQDDIIKLQEENRVLRTQMPRPNKSPAELEDTLEKLALRADSLEGELSELSMELEKTEASRNALARQTGEAYYKARPRIAELEARRKAIRAEIETKQGQLTATKGQLTKARNALKKWTMF